jgi:hypothetical protein
MAVSWAKEQVMGIANRNLISLRIWNFSCGKYIVIIIHLLRAANQNKKR